MRLTFLATVALAASASAQVPAQPSSGAEQYLCVSERSAGFKYDARTSTWNGTTFRTEDKYLIAPSKDPRYAFQVTKVGENISTASCKDGFNEFGYLFCSGLGGDFKFNRDNGRFLLVYAMGYFNVLPGVNKTTDEKSDTPFMDIGKCSPF